MQLAFSSNITESLVKAMEESTQYHSEQHKEYYDYIKTKQSDLEASMAAGKAIKHSTDKDHFDFHAADQWKNIRPFFRSIECGVLTACQMYLSFRI